MPCSALIIQHTAVCPPARVGQWLVGAGCTLTVVLADEGELLPPSLEGFDLLVVMGGQMGAYDDDQYGWLSDTKRLLQESVRNDMVTLAICLGLQLLAVAIGGKVAPAPGYARRPLRCPTSQHQPNGGLDELALHDHTVGVKQSSSDGRRRCSGETQCR